MFVKYKNEDMQKLAQIVAENVLTGIGVQILNILNAGVPVEEEEAPAVKKENK